MVIGLIVAAALVGLIGFGIVGFNKLRTLDIASLEALGGIDVQLTRRADLIPNLVNTVKGYAQHEKGVFEEVTKARGRPMGWVLLMGVIEKLFFPAFIIIMIALGWWEALWVTILAVCVLVTFLSELTSNVATANALLPMIAGTAVALGYDPRLLMIPAGIAASCGFMLPVSTPPHTIVFGTGRIRLSQMMRYGLVLNVVGSAMIVLATYWLLVPQTGIALDQTPEWANNP